MTVFDFATFITPNIPCTLFCNRTIFGILYYYFFALLQSVLAAVFSSVFGSKDPEQVNTMAKQAGEVSIEY